ncbi:hypothetical protein HYV79_00090 [Candidatus Woesearchaeota archaeon]|nr:hypothetical protein [Candidatus Woesearchaeota archaeon]
MCIGYGVTRALTHEKCKLEDIVAYRVLEPGEIIEFIHSIEEHKYDYSLEWCGVEYFTLK